MSRALIPVSRAPGSASGIRAYQLRLHQQPVPYLRFSTVVPQSPPPPPPPPPPVRPTPEEEETLDPSSKVEKTVKAIRKEGGEKSAQVSDNLAKKPELKVATPKRPLAKRIWDELVHYYHGFRLLFIDIRVCSNLLYRILKGEDLSRREHKQLVRTTSDVFRLVPFSVFIIVPFMELLLPIAVKIFPGMLPSTFQDAKDEKVKVSLYLNSRLERRWQILIVVIH